MAVSVTNLYRMGALVVMALVGACGGGGSDALVLVPGNQSPVIHNTITGQYVPRFAISGTANVDADSLQERTFFGRVDDANGLFGVEADIAFTRSSTGGVSFQIYPRRNVLAKAGNFKGSMRISVCPDAACAKQYGGSPFSVPYDITVQDGITLSRTDINVSVPFGTVPPPELVNVDWSSFSAGWTATETTFYDPYATPPSVGIAPYSGRPVSDHVLQVRMGAGRPGIYRSTFRVESRAAMPDLRTLTSEKVISLTYTVEPNPALDQVFYPARHDITVNRSTNSHVFTYSSILNTGTTEDWSMKKTEYLTGAGTSGPYKSWWSIIPYGSVHTCVNDATPANCLTPGVYTAQVRHYLKTPAGAREVLFPIRLTVEP
ncbi:MAG: hypothetical protein V4633_10705 [Pseudomonadota bacterium]